ncbi:hypothetical protein [Pseudomonas sp. AN3A02]|uniref:hypothetical protein n=1 Tax=Pseudomonas sp. AN3A02 TaxID=2719587 RepID=UPI0014320DF1|nr:hypothetical protein [Pseudomonas sp. AN3A02]NIL19745.1 hypothetical protein [Pseudomonas sp. AN3A02]
MNWKKLIEPSVWVIWGLIVGGAGLWVIVGSIGYFGKEGWLPNDTAGWVQAIGAIVAIGIAIWIPYRQRNQEAQERANARTESEISRSEQLLALCKELSNVVGILPDEFLMADYHLTNEMSRTIFADLIERLNYWQRDETNSDRLNLSLELRIKLYDWLKFFSDEADHEGLRLYNKTERELPRIELLQTKIANVGRSLRGEPIVELAISIPSEEDLPF